MTYRRKQKEHAKRRLSHAVGLLTAMLSLAAVELPSAVLASDPSERDHAKAAAPSSDERDSAAVTAMTQRIQAIHEKMLATKTPAERQALMAEHMDVMQEGMKMMQRTSSSSGNDVITSQLMRMRMAMMVQMMMDRQRMARMPISTTPAVPGN